MVISWYKDINLMWHSISQRWENKKDWPYFKKKKTGQSWVWWDMPVFPAPGRQRQEHLSSRPAWNTVRTLTPKPQTKIRLSICISGCLQLSLYKGFQTPNETTGVNPAINPGVCIILPIYSGLILVIPQSSNSTISEQYSSDLTMSELSREIL